MPFEKENIIRLYVENELGVCLEICPNPDAPDFGVLIHTPDDKSKQWFGETNLLLSPDECKTLGEALVEISNQF